MNEDECLGCKLCGYCVYKDHILFKEDGSIYKCPCQSCLIKVLCDINCKEFVDFRKEYISTFHTYTKGHSK